jgi:hypothetical protein
VVEDLGHRRRLMHEGAHTTPEPFRDHDVSQVKRVLYQMECEFQIEPRICADEHGSECESHEDRCDNLG